MVQAELAIDRLEAQTDVTVPSYYFIWPLSPPLWMFLGCEVKCACQPSGCFQRRYHGCIFSEKSMTIKFLFDSRPLMHRSSGRLSWEGVLWSGRSKLCSYFCCSLWQRGKLLRDGVSKFRIRLLLFCIAIGAQRHTVPYLDIIRRC